MHDITWQLPDFLTEIFQQSNDLPPQNTFVICKPETLSKSSYSFWKQKILHIQF